MEQLIQIYHVIGKTKRITNAIWDEVGKNYKLQVHELEVSELEKVIPAKVHLIIFDDVEPTDIHYSIIDKIQKNNTYLHTVYVAKEITQELSTRIYEEHIDHMINASYDDKYIRAKLRTILKRESPKYQINPNFVYKNIQIDRLLREVRVNNEIIDTTNKEYRILKLLLVNAGVFVTKDQILKEIWGYDQDTTRLIDQYIHRLKTKFKNVLEFETDKANGIKVS